MARFYPYQEVIMKSKHFAGCALLMAELIKLDESYEVYFRPDFNCDIPDFVVVRKGYGAAIVKVITYSIKDLQVNITNGREVWINKQTGEQIISPGNNIFALRTKLRELQNNIISKKDNDNFNKVVKCVLFFANNTSNEISVFFEECHKKKINSIIFWKYASVYSNDKIDEIRSKLLIQIQPYLFNNAIKDGLYRYLLPSFHRKEEGVKINFSKKQQLLIISASGKQKIFGVVGSGKTLVLCRRAVNSYLRTGGDVLILTYNITLINLISNTLEKIQEDFPRNAFKIHNYHSFFNTIARNNGLRPFLDAYENVTYFEPIKDRIKKYQAIFIDEIQDYEREWITILLKYFIETNGEYVVFGDEKQNVYKRKLEDKKPYTGIGGKPNMLNESFRLNSALVELAKDFQRQFFSHNMDIDINLNNQIGFNMESERTSLSYIKNYETKDPYTLYQQFQQIAESKKIHPSDISFLSSKTRLIKEIEFFYRNLRKERTTISLETLEEWWRLVLEHLYDDKFINQTLKVFDGEDYLSDHIINRIVESCKSYKLSLVSDIWRRKYNRNIEQYRVDETEFTKWYKQFQEASIPFYKPTEDQDPEGEPEDNLSTFELALKKHRRIKKIRFIPSKFETNFSSIHSYKGWEIQTLFLLIEKDEEQFTSDELIYTGLTRCRANLVIVNLGNDSYDEFYNKYKEREYWQNV